MATHFGVFFELGGLVGFSEFLPGIVQTKFE